MSSLLLRKRKKPAINIIPLMDVLTILIFFFLVSMQFREQSALNLTLPKIDSAAPAELQEKLLISLDETGAIYFESGEVDLEELERRVAEAAVGGADLPVLLRIHKETQFERVAEVFDACRLNGLYNIRIQSR